MKDTKEKILMAASQLFLKGGLAALSVRAIAKKANLSTIGIYSYFNGKQGILDALYIEGFKQVHKATNVAVDVANPKQSILAATEGYIKTAKAYQGHYRLIFGESDAGYQPSEEAKLIGEQAFVQITKLIAHLLPPATSIEQKQHVALQVWSLVHGYVSLQQHAIADVIEPHLWQGLILDAVSLQLDAIQQKYSTS